MTAKRVLLRPQGLRPRPRAPTCPPLATPLTPRRRNLGQNMSKNAHVLEKSCKIAAASKIRKSWFPEA